VFFDDARFDYGFYRGSANEFVEFAMRALKDHHANHHFIGQMSVDLDGDVAFGESTSRPSIALLTLAWKRTSS
jgi:hypothetical protein